MKTKTRKGAKSYTLYKVIYKGFEPDLEKDFYESLGSLNETKWTGSDYDFKGVRQILFNDLTKLEEEKVRKEAKTFLPSDVKFSRRKYRIGKGD